MTQTNDRFFSQAKRLAKDKGLDISAVSTIRALEMAQECLTNGIAVTGYLELLRDEHLRAVQNSQLKQKFLTDMDIGLDARQRSVNKHASEILQALNAALGRQERFVRESNSGRLGVGKEEYIIADLIKALQKVKPELRSRQAVKDLVSGFYAALKTPVPEETLAIKAKRVYRAFVLDEEPKDGDVNKVVSSKRYTHDNGAPKEIQLSAIDLDKLSSLNLIALDNPSVRDEAATFAANTSRTIVVNAAKWFTPIDFLSQLEELWGVMIEIGNEENSIKVPALSQDTVQAETAILNFLNGKTGNNAKLTKTITFDMAFYDSTYTPFKQLADDMAGSELTTTQYLEIHLKTFHDMATENPLRYAKFLLREGVIDEKRFELIREGLQGDVQTIQNIK